jgi:CHAD domain-containing protein
MSNTKKTKSSTAQNWNIKGIEPETRQKVTKAAKKSGVTIGAYVNRVLLEAANSDLSRKNKSEVPVKMDDIQDQLSNMNDAISALAEKLNQPKESVWKKIFG